MAFIIKEDHLRVGLAEASNDREHWLIVYLQMKVSFLPCGKPTDLGIYVLGIGHMFRFAYMVSWAKAGKT